MKGAILLLAALASSAAERRPFAPSDLREWRTVSDVRIRPDGAEVAWVENGALWVGSPDGRERRAVAVAATGTTLPRWSPDGSRLAWVAGGKAHVRRKGAQAETPIDLPSIPQDLAWSAEGDQLAFTLPVGRPAAAPWAPAPLLDRLAAPDPVPQIFVAPASGGTLRQVSRVPAGCRGEAAWSLDGASILAACGDALLSLRVADGMAKTLSREPGLYESPIVSPDGGRIAYIFRERKAQSYTVGKLWVMNADGSRARPLSGSLDRDVTDPHWSSESRTVYFIADDRGATHVYAARNDGTVRQVTARPERLRSFSLADNGRAAAVRSAKTEGGDVVIFSVDVASEPSTVAAPNERLLADRDLGPVEEISFASEGRAIQAWLVEPPQMAPGRKYPLLVDVADDPRRMYGPEFQLRAQILAARGFVVLCANPRGTPGYGEEFGNLLRTRYPGDDFDDLMRGVDAAVGKAFVDPQRVAIVGSLVSAWAIGHTARFYRAVARRPVVDWMLDPDRAAAALGAMPWDEPDLIMKRSPIYYAKSFQTPTLVLAGERPAQAELLYRALRQRQVESALVGPIGDPVLELETILGWLEK